MLEDYETGVFEPDAENLTYASVKQIPDKPWWQFWKKQLRVTWIYTKIGKAIQLETENGVLAGTGWPFVAETFTPLWRGDSHSYKHNMQTLKFTRKGDTVTVSYGGKDND